MGFLAPWFLLGLAAIGLPVYIHLLRRHVTKPLPFSSLMFFERGSKAPPATGGCATCCCFRCAPRFFCCWCWRLPIPLSVAQAAM